MKYFCFRFDADTHKCMKKGIPNLIKLGDELKVQFSFFINMGRAVSISEMVYRILNKNKDESVRDGKANKYTPLQKLGKKDFLMAAIMNPKVGFGNVKIIQTLIEKGHEFGLHGGMNHAKWQNNAHEWSEIKIRKEIGNTLKKLERHKLQKCESFCSPGFTCSPIVHNVLKEFGFEYVSDSYDTSYPRTEGLKEIFKDSNLPNINVNVTTDNGIAYLENLRSRGANDEEILEDFRKQLQSTKRFAIVYDHPYYAGIYELDIVKRMIYEAINHGFIPTTMKNIYEICSNN